MANPIHRINIVAKDKRSQRKVADSTTKLDKTKERLGESPGVAYSNGVAYSKNAKRG